MLKGPGPWIQTGVEPHVSFCPKYVLLRCFFAQHDCKEWLLYSRVARVTLTSLSAQTSLFSLLCHSGDVFRINNSVSTLGTVVCKYPGISIVSETMLDVNKKLSLCKYPWFHGSMPCCHMTSWFKILQVFVSLNGFCPLLKQGKLTD